MSRVSDYCPNYLFLAVFGILAAVVSQIGDLFMSAIKRKYNIKDYGKVFPGHGGVLDRFDSIIAVSTALYLALSFVDMISYIF